MKFVCFFYVLQVNLWIVKIVCMFEIVHSGNKAGDTMESLQTSCVVQAVQKIDGCTDIVLVCRLIVFNPYSYIN